VEGGRWDDRGTSYTCLERKLINRGFRGCLCPSGPKNGVKGGFSKGDYKGRNCQTLTLTGPKGRENQGEMGAIFLSPLVPRGKY